MDDFATGLSNPFFFVSSLLLLVLLLPRSFVFISKKKNPKIIIKKEKHKTTSWRSDIIKTVMFCFVFLSRRIARIARQQKYTRLEPDNSTSVNDTRAPEGYGRGRKQEVVLCQQQSEQCHVVMWRYARSLVVQHKIRSFCVCVCVCVPLVRETHTEKGWILYYEKCL